MRPLLIAGLAWQDYRREARLSACAVLALVAVIAPLLVLFGLKYGLVGSLTEEPVNFDAVLQPSTLQYSIRKAGRAGAAATAAKAAAAGA